MVILLSHISLIHAYGVDPEEGVCEIASLGQMPEKGEQVWSDAEWFAIDQYFAVDILRAPDVRQSDITDGGDMTSLNMTADEVVLT